MIVDAHSHYGKEFYSENEAELTEYTQKAIFCGVTHALIMPVPTPVIEKNGEKKLVLSWDYKNGNIEYVSDIYSDEISNPYREINMKLKRDIEKVSNDRLRLFSVPLIHPIFDSVNYVKEIIELNTVAVKIHCLGAGITPNEVNDNILKLLSAKKIPIIVHVDCDNTKFSSTDGMYYLRKKNRALNWCRLLLAYDCIGIINHGACLDREALKLINENNNLYCGIGPDLYMASNYGRLMETEEMIMKLGYLGILKKSVKPEKLLFDIDYNYNYTDTNGNLEWNSIKRIRNLWNQTDSEKILGYNAYSLYKLWH